MRKHCLPIVACLTIVPTAQAQDTLAASGEVEYAVKFVCGRSTGARAPVAPGAYFTAINLHNPGASGTVFRYKIALTSRDTLPTPRPGPISQFARADLGPDQAVEIDCRHIVALARGLVRDARFLKGFLVVQGRGELDVVAVYSGGTREVTTMDVERVPVRRAGRVACADLVVDTIFRPTYESSTQRSVITARIENVGDAAAPSTLARLIDSSTVQPTGAPYNAIATTPALASGASTIVTFYLPYNVFNPDAWLEVTADYKNDLAECREDNNRMKIELIG
jgi:hypothetical protein